MIERCVSTSEIYRRSAHATNSLRLHCTFVAVCLISFAASLCAQNQQQSTKPEPASAHTVPQASDAQENFPRELMQQLETIKTAAMSDDYAYRQLALLTENIGPRSSGSGGAKAAVEYAAAQMRDLGLDVHLEEIKVRHWVRGAEKAELVDGPGQPAGTQQKIVLTALGGSTSTGADGITADLVAVDNFDQLKALGRDKVAGKIVLFNELFDRQKADAGLAVAAYRETVGYRET